MVDSKKAAARGSVDYEVGKNKPPKEHQFKKGQPSPNPRGRPKGSKNRSSIEKLLDTKIPAGVDTRGRPIKRMIREVVDRTLVNAAIKGDLRAIKILMDYDLRSAHIRAMQAPDAETEYDKFEKEKNTQILVSKFSNFLDCIKELKRLGMVETEGERTVVTPWARECAERRPREDSSVPY